MTPETMEVLQNEWEAKGLVKISSFHQALKINRLNEKETGNAHRGTLSYHLAENRFGDGNWSIPIPHLCLCVAVADL